MTPEQRFERLEQSIDAFRVEVDAFRVEVEKAHAGHEVRLRKLEELQAVLMEAQNDTWRAIGRLTENVDKFIRGRGSNGKEGW